MVRHALWVCGSFHVSNLCFGFGALHKLSIITPVNTSKEPQCKGQDIITSVNTSKEPHWKGFSTVSNKRKTNGPHSKEPLKVEDCTTQGHPSNVRLDNTPPQCQKLTRTKQGQLNNPGANLTLILRRKTNLLNSTQNSP